MLVSSYTRKKNYIILLFLIFYQKSIVKHSSSFSDEIIEAL